jgi:hypothetical protein
MFKIGGRSIICATFVVGSCFAQPRPVPDQNGINTVRAVALDDFHARSAGGSLFNYSVITAQYPDDEVVDQVDRWFSTGTSPYFVSTTGGQMILFVAYWTGTQLDTSRGKTPSAADFKPYMDRVKSHDPSFVQAYAKWQKALNLPAEIPYAALEKRKTLTPALTSNFHIYDATQLIIRYRQNEVAVESAMKGQRIIVHGIATDIAEDIFDRQRGLQALLAPMNVYVGWGHALAL